VLEAAGPAWGDVPTWVGSIGTVAAFGVAAGVYVQSQFDRRRSQAGKVTAWVSGGPIFFPDPVLGELEHELIPAFASEIPVDRPRIWVEFSIRNGSDELISDVIATLLVGKYSSLPEGSFWDGIETRFPEIPPGLTTWRADFVHDDTKGAGIVRLQFTDSAGLRWLRVGGRLTLNRRAPAEPDAERPLGVLERHFL
jgi:hypothetical protein